MRATSPTARDWRPWVTLAARWILGVVLLVAGALKVGDLGTSVQAVRAYRLLPWELTTIVGYALPWLEIALGLLLVTGTFVRWAAVASAALMVVFIIGIASVWARGLSIDCGCFGGGGEITEGTTQYPQRIAEDLGLLALGVWAAVFPRSPLSVDGARATRRVDSTEPLDQTQELPR